MVMEQRWKIKVSVASWVTPWLVNHAAWLYNRYQVVGRTCKTPYEWVHQRAYRGEIHEITQPVMGRESDLTEIPKLDPRWYMGI